MICVRRFPLAANYILILFLILFLPSCEKNDGSVLDFHFDAPLLESVHLLPSVINTDSIHVGTDRKPEDRLKLSTTIKAKLSRIPCPPSAEADSGRRAISSSPLFVKYSLTNPDRSKTLAAGFLRDEGLSPVRVPPDTLLIKAIEFEITRAEVGLYQVDVWGESGDGVRGNMIRTPLSIVRLNRPPVLSNLIAPDTVRLANVNQFILLQIKATDPDGQTDIRKVFFNSFRPDGTPSSGNPFEMYDDGGAVIIIAPDIRSGDLVKGDGVYSLTIILAPNTPLGTYRFEFQAIDRSNATSDIVPHHLLVRP